MKWTAAEEQKLEIDYLRNVPIGDPVKELNRSKRAVYHKISRLNLSRMPVLIRLKLNKISRNLIDKKYYKKTKREFI